MLAGTNGRGESLAMTRLITLTVFLIIASRAQAGGRHAFFRPPPEPVAATAPQTSPTPTAPTAELAELAVVEARIQSENDRILITQGQIADALDRDANMHGLTLGLGLALLGLFGGMLYLMRRAAKASIEAARALPTLERAYVFLGEETRLTPPDPIGPSAQVRLGLHTAFTNHGRTPAEIRWVNLQGQFLSEPPAGVYEDHARRGAGMVIGSGESRRFGDSEFVIPRSEWTRAEAGDGGLYVHGRVVYRDVFGVQHETYFCRRYDVGAHVLKVVESEALNRHD